MRWTASVISFKAQYPNGGWPQFWPRPKGYYTHITYNDNAMVNVMELLREVYEKKAPYEYVPDSICNRARAAFNKGVECILKTQVVLNGKPTVWCAQHDEHTLAPAKARTGGVRSRWHPADLPSPYLFHQ